MCPESKTLAHSGFRLDAGYDFEKGEGRPFHYFSFGAAVSEVEIDCLSGDHTVSAHLSVAVLWSCVRTVANRRTICCVPTLFTLLSGSAV